MFISPYCIENKYFEHPAFEVSQRIVMIVSRSKPSTIKLLNYNCIYCYRTISSIDYALELEEPRKRLHTGNIPSNHHSDGTVGIFLAQLLPNNKSGSRPMQWLSISVPVRDGKKLVLFVNDGGDGFDWDHVVWVDPVLHGPQGKLKLTDLKWINATAGWGNAQVNKTCDGQPLMVNNQLVNGIGTHSESVIIYDLPQGYETFTATGVVTKDEGSVVFGVFVDSETIEYPDASIVKVDFSDIGIEGNAKVVDLWNNEDLGIFNESFSREIQQHGAGLYRISPLQ